MDRTERVELTTLCMVYRGDKILLQNRVKTDWRGYCFPGGHVEPEESIVDSVIREIREETGLTISNPRLCGIKQFPIDGGRYLVFFFKTDRYTGTLTASDEGTVEWIQRKDLPNLNKVSDFMDMLKVFDCDDLTEFQYVVENDNWNVVLK